MRNILQKVTEYAKQRKNRKLWYQVFCCMAAVVVFATTYALILPAITMEREPVCGLEEHTHTDKCYEYVLAHMHDDSCYRAELASDSNSSTGERDLICVIDTEVLQKDRVLVCELTEHKHNDKCYPVATSNNAYIESEDEWKLGLPEELTGEWRVDLLSVAKTQIGYVATDSNAAVDDRGEEFTYNRYGDWYGNDLGDMSAMFVSFCLNYAEIDEDVFPQSDDSEEWITVLKARDAEVLVTTAEKVAVNLEDDEIGESEAIQLYFEADKHTPGVGDIVFFDKKDDISTAIVVETATEENSSIPTEIKVVEGNSKTHEVRYKTYKVDEAILGYGVLPDQGLKCDILGHIHDEDCYNGGCFGDENELICKFEEHVHIEECWINESDSDIYMPRCDCYSHTHNEKCYDASGELLCELEEHVHTEACLYPEDFTVDIGQQMDQFVRIVNSLPTLGELNNYRDLLGVRDEVGANTYLIEVLSLKEGENAEIIISNRISEAWEIVDLAASLYYEAYPDKTEDDFYEILYTDQIYNKALLAMWDFVALWNEPIVYTAQENGALNVDKTVSEIDENGNAVLTLEAYAEGEINTVAQPVDIILILDQSGSMLYTYDGFENDKTYVRYGEDAISNHSDLETGGWYLKIREKAQVRGYYTNGQFPDWSHKAPALEYKPYTAGVFGQNKGDWWQYDIGSGSLLMPSGINLRGLDVNGNLYKSRLGALVDATTEFAESVRQDALASGVDHRIAVVGFSNGSNLSYGATELYVGSETYPYNGALELGGISVDNYQKALQDISTDEGYINIMASLNADRHMGSQTNPDCGLDIAGNIIDNTTKNDGRKQVVILFTDGVPEGPSGTPATGNRAIAQAKELKEKGAEVYAVSIYNSKDNATWDNDLFMSYVSSNYPEAASMGNPGSVNSKTGYSLNASNSRELLAAFQNITQEVTSTEVTLDETTVLRDVMSEYFVIKDVDGNGAFDDISVYTADYKGKGLWDDEIIFEDAEVDVQADSINVSGFSYKDTYIYESGEETLAGGQKLIVKVPIKVREGFWGGNNVPTNKETSAIYAVSDGGKEDQVKAFPEPELNIPLYMNLEAEDKTIYYGGEATADDLAQKLQLNAGFTTTDGVADKNEGGMIVKVNADGTFEPAESWMDDYATMTWMIDGSGKTALDQIIDNKDCGTYTYSVVLQPNTEGTQNLQSNPSNIEGIPVNTTGISASDNSHVHVLVPTVVFKDSTIILGETPDANYYNQFNLVSTEDNIDWNDMNRDTNIPSVNTTQKPSLSYIYTPVDDDFFTDTPVNVSVLSSNVDGLADSDITSVVNYEWRNVCGEEPLHDTSENVESHKGSENVEEFWIHVWSGYELPETGGPGTGWFLTLGGLFTAIATMCFGFMQRRKSERRAR